jgi:transposase-like protein
LYNYSATALVRAAAPCQSNSSAKVAHDQSIPCEKWALSLSKSVQVAKLGFEGGAVWRPREEVASFAEIAPDPRRLRRAIRIDVDLPDALLFVTAIVCERELPTPSWIICNPRSGHAHVAFELASWVREETPKAIAFFHRTREAYRRLLRGDKDYPGKFMHNPCFEGWEAWGDGRRYDLRDLADAVGAEISAVRKTRRSRADDSPLGRNCALFESVRLEAYRIISEFRVCRDYAGFFARIEGLAAETNAEFTPPLSASEVRSTVGSIARFCWDRYRSSNIGRTHKQTRQEYLGSVEARRRRAAQMRAGGLSTCAIALELQVSRRTIQRWRDLSCARVRA